MSVAVTKDSSWVFKTFRPALKKLRLQYTDVSPTILVVAEMPTIPFSMRARCVIIVQRCNVSFGYTVYRYFVKENILFLVINLNDKFFEDNSLDSRTTRKALSVHEFTHCVAGIVPLDVYTLEKYVKKLGFEFQEVVKNTTSVDFGALLKYLAVGDDEKDLYSRLAMLTDEHFRLVRRDEDAFIGHYGELYLDFIVSYDLIHETFYKLKTGNPGILFHDLLGLSCNRLIEEKAIEKNFVISRLTLYLDSLKREFA